MTPWEFVAAVGQACFFSRVLIQWIASERAGRSVSPRIYWWLSVAGAWLMAGACIALEEWVLLPGYLINSALYGRNLALKSTRSALGLIPSALIALAAALFLIGFGLEHSQADFSVGFPWLVAGIFGQVLWSTRFLVQWWFSERRGSSHFPASFWWFSLLGAVLNLGYTWQLESPVFWVGFVLAWMIPARNLMLMRRQNSQLSPSTGDNKILSAPHKIDLEGSQESGS